MDLLTAVRALAVAELDIGLVVHRTIVDARAAGHRWKPISEALGLRSATTLGSREPYGTIFRQRRPEFLEEARSTVLAAPEPPAPEATRPVRFPGLDDLITAVDLVIADYPTADSPERFPMALSHLRTAEVEVSRTLAGAAARAAEEFSWDKIGWASGLSSGAAHFFWSTTDPESPAPITRPRLLEAAGRPVREPVRKEPGREVLYRNVVALLHERPGLDYSEIAKRLDAPEAAVRHRVWQARVRGELYDYGPDIIEMPVNHYGQWASNQRDAAQTCLDHMASVGLDTRLGTVMSISYEVVELRVEEIVPVRVRADWEQIVQGVFDRHGGTYYEGSIDSVLHEVDGLGTFDKKYTATEASRELQRNGLPCKVVRCENSWEGHRFAVCPRQPYVDARWGDEYTPRRNAMEEIFTTFGGWYDRAEPAFWQSTAFPVSVDATDLTARLRPSGLGIRGDPKVTAGPAARVRAAAFPQPPSPGTPPTVPPTAAPGATPSPGRAPRTRP